MSTEHHPTGKLASALAKVQGEMTPAKKEAVNPHLKTTYADLESCWTSCRTLLAQHEIAVVQAPQVIEGQLCIETSLVHASGETMVGRIPVIYGAAKGLTAMQSMGSALTYARRYGLCAMVGICTEDDDGTGAGASVCTPTKQATAPKPKATSNPKPDSDTSPPRNGTELLSRLQEYERKLVQAGRCLPGDLLEKVNIEVAKTGVQGKLESWSATGIALACEIARSFPVKTKTGNLLRELAKRAGWKGSRLLSHVTDLFGIDARPDSLKPEEAKVILLDLEDRIRETRASE